MSDELEEEFTSLPTMDDFINYNPMVGPLQLLEIGYPGSGKSSHATNTITLCMERKNESVIMHGDNSCEWRHYLRYSKYFDKVLVLIPEEAEIYFIVEEKEVPKFDVWKYKVELEIKAIDFNSANFVDYLEAKQVTVIYDDCFNPEVKSKLWARIAKQLVLRRHKNTMTITYLCHEAGNYFPQRAQGDQWSYINDFADWFVHFRRRRIRALLLAQLENEVYDRIRNKCIYRVYRKCYPTNRTHAKRIQKYILNMRIDHYHLFFGDLFNPMRSNKPIREIRRMWLMIPRDLINLNGSPPGGKGEQTRKITFETRIQSNKRVRWGKELEKLGLSEGDQVEVTIHALSRGSEYEI